MKISKEFRDTSGMLNGSLDAILEEFQDIYTAQYKAIMGGDERGLWCAFGIWHDDMSWLIVCDEYKRQLYKRDFETHEELLAYIIGYTHALKGKI